MNERQLGVAASLRSLLEHIEATELSLDKAGERQLSNALYQTRLRISEELRDYEQNP